MSNSIGSTLRVDLARVDSTFWSYVPGLQVPNPIVDIRKSFAAAHPAGSPKGLTSLSYSKPGCLADVKKFLASKRDASTTHLVAENAALFVVRYPHCSGKPMEAWLDGMPPDGKLRLNLAITPSWHFGATEAEMDKNAKHYARSNVYEVEVAFPDGKLQRLVFDVNGKSTTAQTCQSEQEVLATSSPTFDIDLGHYRGQDVAIRGWPRGSCGVTGFREARETILHVPG